MTTLFRDSIFRRILAEELALLRDPFTDLAPHFDSSAAFLASIPDAKATHAYAPGKWTVAEVVGHLLDTRVVFLNRLLYLARGETAPLLPFDEQLWVRSAGHSGVPFAALRAQWKSGADLVLSIVQSLPAGSREAQGLANGILITVEEIILYLIAHEQHHLRVLAERYLTP